MKVLDVGCGSGVHVKALRDAGIDAHGVDIDATCPYDVCDVFSNEFTARYMDGSYDVCMSLRVAEHLEFSKKAIFVERLVSVAPTVLFSAAPSDTQDFWRALFGRHKYELDEQATVALRTFIPHVQVYTKTVDASDRTQEAAQLAEYLKGKHKEQPPKKERVLTPMSIGGITYMFDDGPA